MQIQNLQINHACSYVFLKPEKTLMFFGVFLLQVPQWIKLIPNLSEQSLTAGVHWASSTRRGQEDSCCCCCCCQPVPVSKNTVCWLIWCLLSSRWDHPPHPLLPFTPTDWDWDWDWEGGWCRSLCFLTPTPLPPSIYTSIFARTLIDRTSSPDTAITPNLTVLTLSVNKDKKERETENVCVGSVCVWGFTRLLFGGTDYFVRTPPGNLIRKAVMMIAIRINYKPSYRKRKGVLDVIPRRETNHYCSDGFPAIKRA